MSEAFEFTPENRKRFDDIVGRYPVRRAAMLPVLHLAQEQNGYISPEVEDYVASLLDVPVVAVREVLSFYTLFRRQPEGKHHIRLCMSIACWIRGCDQIRERLREKLGIEEGLLGQEHEITWEAVPDCLGACELAPMMQLDGYFEGPLTPEKVDELLAREVGGNGNK